MKRGIANSIHEFRKHWKNYVFQSLFATLVIFFILLSLSLQENAVIIASLGASTFIVFAMPEQITAKPRNIIGGYIVGFLCGLACSLIPVQEVMNESLGHSLFYAVAVGLSIFIMVVIDTEHPPASGVALGVAINGFSLNVVISIIASVVVLTVTHHFFKRCLRDLT
jgi:CBS-domain-containing membrane protein